MSENEKLGNFALSLAEDVKKLNEQISTLKEALLPFAKMHRPGCDLNELACKRGVVSDQTVLSSEDFRNAALALGWPADDEEQWDPYTYRLKQALPGLLAGCAEREKARKEARCFGNLKEKG